MTEATIVVIPKKDKDPLNTESYRPISLLISDVKILANGLNKVISKIFHSEKMDISPTYPLPPVLDLTF